MKNPEFNKVRSLFTAFVTAFIFLFIGCPHTPDTEQNPQDNKESDNPKEPESDTDNTAVIYKFFWGTWQRMDNGNLYVIDENKITVYDSDGKKSKEYTASSSTNTTLSASSFTFTKDSDRIITCDNIPYFRKGGTNLEYKLKLVGFEDSVARAAATTDVSGILVKGQSKKYPSYTESTYSDEDGNIVLHAPVSGDIQTVTISNDDSVIVVPGIKIDNNGSNLGTIPIANSDQYLLKITGSVDEADKTDGYLYANGYKAYPLNLTITNIGDKDCNLSYYEIIPADNFLTVSATGTNTLKGSIPTMIKGASQTVSLSVECGNIDSAYVDTGINVRLSNDSGTWIDFIPLRFYKGLVPITFSAVSVGENPNAALNGFVIYPDNNTKFFAVDQRSSRTLYLPSFGNQNKYMLVFSGATTSQILNESTEMYYTVAIGTTNTKIVKQPGSSEEQQQYFKFGNDGNSLDGNGSEEDAFYVKEDFEACLAKGDKDYYSVSFDDDSIMKAVDVPKDYWSSSTANVTAIDTTVASNSYGISYGTFANDDSWVTYKFYADKSGTYEIEWGDAEHSISQLVPSLYGLTAKTAGENANNGKEQDDTTEITYVTSYINGTCKVSVQSNTSETFSNTASSNSSVYVSYSRNIFIQVKSNSVEGGTFAIRVKDPNGDAKDLFYVSGSGYAGFSWTCGSFNSNTDSDIYYFYASKGVEYTLNWSDGGEGFGHTSDVKVSACVDYADFSFKSSKKIFEDKDNGYNLGQSFSVDENKYVFIQVKPQNIINSYKGNYALKLTYRKDDHTYLEDLKIYDNSSFALSSGADITNEYAWLWGSMTENGYEVFKFPVVKNTPYSIVWDDSKDGCGDYTADIKVSAYSDEKLTSLYWTEDSGYSSIKSVTPTADGFVYVKIVRNDAVAQTQRTFRVCIAHGSKRSLSGFVEEVDSLNCNFEGYQASQIPDSAWISGNLKYSYDREIYYFTNPKNSFYKIYVDDNYLGTETYSGRVSVCRADTPILTENDEFYSPYYRSAVSSYFNEAGMQYIVVKPSSIGSYAISVLDGKNNPVELKKYTAVNGTAIPEEKWLEGSVSSASDTLMYRFEVKKNTYTRIFWDDKKSGSGKCTADIQVMFDGFGDKNIVDKVFDNGYTAEDSKYWFSNEDDAVLYMKVSAKDGVSENIGTFRIAVMQGNDENTTLSKIDPASINVSSASDIKIKQEKIDTVYTFSVDSGYKSYKWYIDGELVKNASLNTLQVDTASWAAGTYEIEVEVESENNSQYYSDTVFLKIGE